jgi:signal transduction histidine kinase
MPKFHHVLLIEDNPGDVRLVRELFRGQEIDCRVDAVGTLADALETLGQMYAMADTDLPGPDIILLDLGLPDSLGLDACLRLQRAAPRTPIVILTGNDDEAQALEALRLGAEDYLPKQDMSSVRLVRTMRHAMRRRMNIEELLAREARLRSLTKALEDGGRQVEDELARVKEELEARKSERTAVLDRIQLDMQRLAQAVTERRPLPASGTKPLLPALPTLPATTATAPGAGRLTQLAGQREAPGRQTLDLSAMARRILAELSAAEPQRRARITVEEGLVDAGDPQRVEGLLRRLLDNAWKFSGTQAETRIELSAVRSERAPTVYRLQDNGIGFDLAGAATLFEPFQRMASAQGWPGIGLGLSVAREAVERHGGRIWAESAPGRGSVFYFTLRASAS